MTVNCPDDYSESSDDTQKIPLIDPSDLRQQAAISRDLCILPVPGDNQSYALRAKMIRRYIAWLLNSKEDEVTKQVAGYLTRKYQSNLLVVVEQALCAFSREHGELHPEFPLLRNAVERLRKQVAKILE